MHLLKIPELPEFAQTNLETKNGNPAAINGKGENAIFFQLILVMFILVMDFS